jgi:creatinine amidohydrolase/Fe(II)-dependent formamide hydrolase-like protein
MSTISLTTFQSFRLIFMAWVCFFTGILVAQTAPSASSRFIEDLTWMEIKAAIQLGNTTALYYAGSTEQNGPHMATGKHNFIAKHVAGRIAAALGNALVYPVLPFAPTGDALKRTQHMAYAGSVSLQPSVYAAVARDVTTSAAASGFKCIALMGDHGGGQAQLAAVAKTLTRAWAAKGVRVVHVIDVYERSNQMAMALLNARGLPYGDHASIIDTSELMFVAPHAVRLDQRAMANATNGSSGLAGLADLATAELGEQFIGFKVQAATEQIRKACSAPK